LHAQLKKQNFISRISSVLEWSDVKEAFDDWSLRIKERLEAIKKKNNK